ncbi:MAG: hypothetical protein JOS17DRAFT_765832 [Linnemannia elongata]|nr:MAG: hypothetical protein JOS17DRAFT_765832 [Linnemannia elongata]
MLRFSLDLLNLLLPFLSLSIENHQSLFSHSLLSLSHLLLFFILIPFSHSLTFLCLPSHVIFNYSTLSFVYGKQQR